MNSHYELLFYNCFCVADAGVDTDDAAELSPDFFGPVAGQANETTGAGQGGSVRPGFATRRLHRRRRLARASGRAEAAGAFSSARAIRVRNGGYVNWASGTEINHRIVWRCSCAQVDPADGVAATSPPGKF